MSPVAETGAVASAVLVAFFMAPAAGEAELHMLLTRRSWGLRTHSGEVAFPGGRCELDEPTRDAALREAWEETGLEPAEVETLGELDHLTTVTRRAYIVPQVAVVTAPMDLRANPAEVEQILLVPVSELLGPEVFREEQWGAPDRTGRSTSSSWSATRSGVPRPRSCDSAWRCSWGPTLVRSSTWIPAHGPEGLPDGSFLQEPGALSVELSRRERYGASGSVVVASVVGGVVVGGTVVGDVVVGAAEVGGA
ncbi:MAG: CoA pyrophosphatase [Microthrixaceae bacterium]|nr:CoA pyrophosphatase [Microthrixaceae bacterium]